MNKKPLGRKAYGSIPHLIGSRRGPADIGVHEGQHRICTEQVRDKHDLIIVQEKLDGSCCSVAKIDGEIVPLTRAGYHASTSPFPQHHMFAEWVADNHTLFNYILCDGERVVGEWLAQAHGTMYNLHHGPFVAFDIIVGTERFPFDAFHDRVGGYLPRPRHIHSANAPFSIEAALGAITVSGHGAIDAVEGAVWRVERKGNVDFLAKFVRHGKVDGCYLPEVSGQEAVWNWKPDFVCA